MSEQKPCCEAAAARLVKKLTLSDGFQVGIVNLASILKEVAELKLTDAQAIKTELLERVKWGRMDLMDTKVISGRIERRRCQFERYPTRKIHPGIPAGSGQIGSRR